MSPSVRLADIRMHEPFFLWSFVDLRKCQYDNDKTRKFICRIPRIKHEQKFICRFQVEHTHTIDVIIVFLLHFFFGIENESNRGANNNNIELKWE